MADRYLIESGAPDGYLLEDASGVLLLEVPSANITEVGGGSQRAAYFANTAQTTGVQAYPANVGNGNLLICAGRAWISGAAPTITSVATTRSANLTIIQAAVSASSTAWIAYGPATSAGACTVTVTASAAAFISYAIDEFTGQDATTPFSVNGGTSTGTGTAASDGLTTLTSGELIIGVVGHSASFSETITEAQTLIGETENYLQHEPFNTSFQIAGAAGAYTMDWTLGSSVDWQALTASFKASPAADTALSISAQALSSFNGSLTSLIRLSASAQCVAAGPAQLSTSIQLIGASQAGSSAGASLSTQVALVSVPIASASVNASLSTSILLASVSTGLVTSDANLSTPINMSTVALAMASLNSALSANIKLLASQSALASTNSALASDIRLTSIAASMAISSVNLSASIRLSVPFAAGSALTATLASGGNIINAASPSQADVQAAINAAADGDTVQIPTGTATWSTNVTIPNTKGIKLRGFSNTTTDTITLASTLTPTTAETGNAQVRITNFRFVRQAGFNGNFIKMLGLAKTWRIDHIVFDENGQLDTNNRTIEIGIKGDENPDSYNYGVIDNCQFIGRNACTNLHVSWVRWGALQFDVVASGDYIWSLNQDIGSARAVYVEDCTFSDHASATGASQICDTQYGGQIVIRSCTILNPWINTHSGWTNRGRNTPWTEVYNNTFTQDANQYGGFNVEFRSTSGVIYNNTSVDTWDAGLDHERSWRNDPNGGAYSLRADGTRAFDENVGLHGYRALGQPGWGPPQLNDMSNPTFSGVFCLDNIANGSQVNLAIYNDTINAPDNYTTEHIQAGREVFRDANVTKGLIANRPTTCNPGPAGRSVYVSTDENPQGIVIYVCLSTNVWTKHWEPYTYPHPLRSAAEPPVGLVSAAQATAILSSSLMTGIRINTIAQSAAVVLPSLSAAIRLNTSAAAQASQSLSLISGISLNAIVQAISSSAINIATGIRLNSAMQSVAAQSSVLFVAGGGMSALLQASPTSSLNLTSGIIMALSPQATAAIASGLSSAIRLSLNNSVVTAYAASLDANASLASNLLATPAITLSLSSQILVRSDKQSFATFTANLTDKLGLGTIINPISTVTSSHTYSADISIQQRTVLI